MSGVGEGILEDSVSLATREEDISPGATPAKEEDSALEEGFIPEDIV